MLLPDAVADPSRPAGLDADQPGPPITNFIDCVEPVFMPRKNETGLFAKRPFEEGDTILCTRAALATTPGIFPLQLRGTSGYKGGREHRINALHSIQAVMKAYEHHSDPVHAHRPFSPFLSTSSVLDSLQQPPSLQVELVLNTIEDEYLKPEDGATQTEQAENKEQENEKSSQQDSNDTYCDAVLRVQRFLEGGLVADDVGDHYMVYSHLTSFLNHSCVPNAMLITSMEDRPNAQHPFAKLVNVYLKALWPIAEGEEVTVGYYIMFRGSRKMRRQAIQANLGFICQCTHCVKAHDEETMTAVERYIFDIVGEPTGPPYPQEWHRSAQKLFDALSSLGLNGILWFGWSIHVATALEAQGTPDFIRSYYFRRQALDWCRKWLGDAHSQTKDLTSYNSFLAATKPQVKAFVERFPWDFLTSRTAQNVLCLTDSPPEDRLTGEDCVPALEELLAAEKMRERKQKKNKTSRQNRARKKVKKQQEAANSDLTTAPGEPALSDDGTISNNVGETQALQPSDQDEQNTRKPESRSDSSQPEVSVPDPSYQVVEKPASSAAPLDAERCGQNQSPPPQATTCDRTEQTAAPLALTDADQVGQNAPPLESEPAITQVAEKPAPLDSIPEADPVVEKTTFPGTTPDANGPENVADPNPVSIIDQVQEDPACPESNSSVEQVAETVATPGLVPNAEQLEHNNMANDSTPSSAQIDEGAPISDLPLDTDQIHQQIASLDLAHDSDQPEEPSMLSNATSSATDATAAVEIVELEERRSSESEDVSVESSIVTPDDKSTHSTGPDFLAVDGDSPPQDTPVATDQPDAAVSVKTVS